MQAPLHQRTSIVLLFSLICAISTFGQQTNSIEQKEPPAASVTPVLVVNANSAVAPVEEEQVIELSPFVVSVERDRGYTPGSVTSGSRLAVTLRETSAVVGVMTKEFLDDIGATAIQDAAEWGPNVYFDGNENLAATVGFSPNAVVRGVPGSFNSMARNYFIAYVPVDTVTTERVEIPRGPNAALYGDAPLGGLINSNSKRAKPQQNFTEITAITNSNGTLRGSFDVNVSKSDKLAVRVNAMTEERKGWRDNDVSKSRTLLLSGTWKLLPTTTFRGEIELDYSSRTAPSENYADSVSVWDHTTVISAPLASNPAAATGVTTFSTSKGSDYWVYENGDQDRGLVNWKGYGRSVGRAALALLPDPAMAAALRPGLPAVGSLPSREFSFSPSGTPFTEKRTALLAGYLEHVFFKKLTVELAYQYVHPEVKRLQGAPFNNYFIDVNKVRPDGTPNPHFGEAFSDIEYFKAKVSNWVYDGRLLAAYPIKWGFMEQKMVAMAGQHRDRFDNASSRLTRVNGTSALIQSPANIIRIRRYASDTNTDIGEPFDSSGVDVEWRAYQLTKQDATTNYGQIALAGRYWNGRVSTTFGLRHDEFTQDATTPSPSAASLPNTQAPGYFWNSSDPVRKATPTKSDDYPQHFRLYSKTAGVVYFPIRSLGVFVNYSEGFNVVGTGPHLDGTPWNPPKNTGNDIGLKLELFDGRISGTVSHYDSTREGVDNFGSVAGRFRTLWGSLVKGYNNQGNLAAAAAAQAEQDAIFGNALADRTTKAEGWEVDLTANLTKNWRAIFNYAVPRTTLQDAAAEMKAYYQAHVATWQSVLEDPAFDRAAMDTQLAGIGTFFAVNADGRVPTGVPDYTARFYTTYRVPSGWLKGLRFGGGMRFDGPRVIGVPQVYQAKSTTAGVFVTPDPMANLKSQSTVMASAMVGYDFKLWKRPISVQMNVENLFDNDNLIWTGYATYTYASGGVQTGYQVPSAFRYIAPRLITLRVTAKF